jgi:tRNA C32,U32 (ribose-2'-O)-methylase TrmJ
MRMSSHKILNRGEINSIISNFDIKGWYPSYKLSNASGVIEYKLTIFSSDADNFQRLAEELAHTEQVVGFHILPTGD